MTGVVLGALRERSEGEKRVAVSPASVKRLLDGGVSVLVESGAGASAWFADADYVAAGAAIASLQDIIDNAHVIACVGTPPVDVISRIGSASTGSPRYLAGLLGTSTDPWTAEQLRSGNMIGLDLTLLPRTISSAQSMDALTSQASVAGYKAAILAADTFGRYFPMMMTAAGTVRPTQMLVLGTGIAGLQAIGTALRLGAEVTGYDVRSESRAEVQSLGASFLDTHSVVNGGVANGYARELTSDEHTAQQRGVQDAIARFDIVLTTASVPGKRPPMLVTAAALNRMRPGSVVIDMAAGTLGGNVEGSTAESTVVTPTGVSVIGAASLASKMPAAASMAYARNIADFVLHFVRDGAMTIDQTDPIDAAVVVHAPTVHEPLSTERQEVIA